MQAQGERSWGRWELLSRSLSGVKVLWCKHCDNSLNWPVQLGSRSFAVLEVASGLRAALCVWGQTSPGHRFCFAQIRSFGLRASGENGCDVQHNCGLLRS